MPKTEMLINHVPGEECRIAIVEDGVLEELYQERQSSESHVGNIYKGRVSNVEPSIQAAFIDFGLDRNGFLHITDLHPRYFPGKDREETERVGKKTPHRHRPPIQQCLKRGQEILVQVIKEGIGTKGPTLSSYLSIAGRYLVMMPHMERLGVSRKIEDEDLRRSLRKTLDELDVPDGFGFIIRTAGIEKSKTDLKRDLSYLQRLWKAIDRRMEQPGVGELYTEQDLVIRTLRDVFTTDIARIVVDDPTAAKRASDFLAIASPRARSKVLYYDDPVPMYERYGVEKQIETIQARTVPLKSGGSLVIDSTEALVAIDVNSGKMRQHKNSDTTAYKVNQEACDEVCRQLRLRDLGGVVVIDLIDMRESKKRRSIESQFRDNLKKDRARTKVLPISQLGLLEMTRQRMRPSLKKSVYNDCEHCNGTGHIKSEESVVLEAMRRLSVVMSRADITRVEIVVSPSVAFHLLNRKRAEIVRMEQETNTQVLVRVNSSGSIEFIEISAFNEGGPVTPDGSKLSAEPTLTPVSDLTEEQLAAEEALADANANDVDSDVEKSDGTDAPAKFNGESEEADDGEEKPKRKRRRRRRRRGKSTDQGELPAEGTDAEAGAETEAGAEAEATGKASEDAGDSSPSKDDVNAESIEEAKTDTENSEESGTKPKRRRRRRRGKKKGSGEGTQTAAPHTDGDGDGSAVIANDDDSANKGAAKSSPDTQSESDTKTQASAEPENKTEAESESRPTYSNKPGNFVKIDAESDTEKPRSKRSRRKRSRKPAAQTTATVSATAIAELEADTTVDDPADKPVPKKKSKRTRRKKSLSKATVAKASDPIESADPDDTTNTDDDASATTTTKKKTSRKKAATRTVKKKSTARKVYPPPSARRSPE